MAELADAHDSGSCERTLLQVQVLFPAPETIVRTDLRLVRIISFPMRTDAIIIARGGLPPNKPACNMGCVAAALVFAERMNAITKGTVLCIGYRMGSAFSYDMR